MNQLRLALQFLTIVPTRPGPPPAAGDLGRAAVWFPWVGLGIGVATWGAWLAFDAVLPAATAAIGALAVWVSLSGALHLDGLADCCDGLFHPSGPERRLEIMSDPRLGSFGVIGLILFLLLKGSALAALPADAGAPLIVAATTARWLLVWAGRQPLARPGGMGADFARGLDRRTMLLAALLPLALTVALTIAQGWRVVAAVAAAHAAAWLLFRLARRRLGGVTGDVLGLTVEFSEFTILLVYAAG